jgi:ribokinase
LPHRRAAESAPRVTVVGSVNLDLVVRCQRLPQPGETVTDATFERHPGGKGANQAVAAARLGADVTLVASVGDDDFADEALAGLRAAGVELRIATRERATGVAMILVDVAGENEIAVAPGANALLSPDDALVGGAVITQLEIPLETVNRAAERSERFFLNAAPARALPRRLLQQAELIVVNRHELAAIPERLQGELRLVVTLGPEGAVLLERGTAVARAPAPTVRAVDGTAAGDAFTACLVVSLLEDRPLEEALRRACAAGALAASRPGAQPSLPTAAEVDALLESAS